MTSKIETIDEILLWMRDVFMEKNKNCQNIEELKKVKKEFLGCFKIMNDYIHKGIIP